MAPEASSPRITALGCPLSANTFWMASASPLVVDPKKPLALAMISSWL